MEEEEEADDKDSVCTPTTPTTPMITSAILDLPDVNAFFMSIFDHCDTNKDGVVSISELRHFLQVQENEAIPEHVVNSICRQFDKNQDMQLDFVEFLDMINNRTFRETFQEVGNRILKFVVIPQKNRKTIRLNRTISVTGTYEKEIKCNRNVVGMIVISIIQLIFFHTNEALKKDHSGPLGTALKFDPCKKSQIYRYVSYALVHHDYVHLYTNVLIQVILGIPLEMVHTWRVLVIYVIGVIGGALTHSVVIRNNELVGGSGGAFAFCSAHISVVIMNWREMIQPVAHLLIFGIVISIDVVYSVFMSMHASDEVSYSAHAGGAVVGLLLGVNILRNIRLTKTENIIWYISLVSLGTLALIFIIMDAVLPPGERCF